MISGMNPRKRRYRRNSGREFTIAFSGKHRGAIGRPQHFEVTVTAPNAKAAVLKLYDKYDHIHFPKLIVGGKAYSINRNPRYGKRRKSSRRRRRNCGCKRRR